MVRDLAANGKDSRPGVLFGQVGQCGIDLGGEFDLVHVVLSQGIVNAEGKTGPDNIIGVNGGDEQSRSTGLDVVCNGAVGNIATSEVVKVSALSEMLGRIAVFQQLGQASLEVNDTVGVWLGFAHLFDDAIGVGLAGVFALEDSLKIPDHDVWCWC